MRTNDLGVAPVLKDNAISGFQVYVGGGQGEKNGAPTMAALAVPLGICSEENLLKVMDAVVQVHQEWGDRQNRQWARLKYVIKKQGIDWFREQVEKRLDFKLEAVDENLDYGEKLRHHGWQKLPTTGKLAYGAFIENGRLWDCSENGKLKSMVRHIVDKYKPSILLGPEHELLFCGLEPGVEAEFIAELEKFGYGKRNGKNYSVLRKHSGACVGLYTCSLAYTESEQFEPQLIDELEKRGWGDLKTCIGMTGCERQCYRPATKAVGLVGSGKNRYLFKFFATEDGRHQGYALRENDESVLFGSVPRENVVDIIDAIFKHYKENKKDGETFGYFMRRLGNEQAIAFFRGNKTTASLIEKPRRGIYEIG